MREIKFRFWDKDLKKMCHRKPLTYDFSVENIIPLQFTGFKDKNGNEIYEGDILGDWEVFFDEKLGQWMLDCSSVQDKSTSYALFKEIEDFEYEIIGNIYEK